VSGGADWGIWAARVWVGGAAARLERSGPRVGGLVESRRVPAGVRAMEAGGAAMGGRRSRAGGSRSPRMGHLGRAKCVGAGGLFRNSRVGGLDWRGWGLGGRAGRLRGVRRVVHLGRAEGDRGCAAMRHAGRALLSRAACGRRRPRVVFWRRRGAIRAARCHLAPPRPDAGRAVGARGRASSGWVPRGLTGERRHPGARTAASGPDGGSSSRRTTSGSN
jgi:hypothetical protein